MKYDNTLLIGITGKAGSGKDTLCDMMLKFLKKYEDEGTFAARASLADQLKRTAAMMYGVHPKLFNNRNTKETPLEVLNGQSPRQVLQQFGTEYVRENLGADHWIKMVEKDMPSLLGFNEMMPDRTNIIIVPDVRFANEREWIRENNGALIKIERSEEDLDVGEIDITHASESEAYTEFEYDFFVDNSYSLMMLRLDAKSILNDIGLT